MKDAIQRTFNSPVYKRLYEAYKNTDNLQEKEHKKDKMLAIMIRVYNGRKNRAKQRVIYEYKLDQRAKELYNQFAGKYGRIQ